MISHFLRLAIIASMLSQPAVASEYIFRDLMANTLPSPGCMAEADALKRATNPYNIAKYSKRFCQTQGYGWYVETVKDNGKPVCLTCGESDASKKQCHIEDIIVTCKRLKPGSAGLIPGKS